jgi:ElaB/YqjD/DUF883 family membrane-anchored ribosome-binding protein
VSEQSTPNLSIVDDAYLRQREAEERLRSGGGGGTSGGMEERVAKLEATLEHAKRDISELRADVKTMSTDVATLKENVRHLPTKPWMFQALGALLVAITAAVALLIRFLPHA